MDRFIIVIAIMPCIYSHKSYFLSFFVIDERIFAWDLDELCLYSTNSRIDILEFSFVTAKSNFSSYSLGRSLTKTYVQANGTKAKTNIKRIWVMQW